MLYSQNLQKQTRNFFQNGGGGGAPGVPVLDPPLVTQTKKLDVTVIFQKNLQH